MLGQPWTRISLGDRGAASSSSSSSSLWWPPLRRPQLWQVL
jgi:hypothetical protein